MYQIRIEPDWNVNWRDIAKYSHKGRIRIEPDWNVNSFFANSYSSFAPLE